MDGCQAGVGILGFEAGGGGVNLHVEDQGPQPEIPNPSHYSSS